VTAAIEVEGLTRRFGALVAVDGLDFAVAPGQVLGFIGANGAGKTTTLRLVATLDVPSAGRIRVLGTDAVDRPSEVRRRLGWMPDSYGAYPHVSVAEYLDFFARAYGFAGRERRLRVAEVLDFTGLSDSASQAMDSLSKGWAQRLCLARALLPDPPVLLLDEPAAGLDPKARLEFKRLVRLLAGEGKALLISSHILSELEEMCDALLFIDRGRIVHHGSAASLKELPRQGALVVVQIEGDVERLREQARMQPGVTVVDAVPGGLRLRLESADPAALAACLRGLVQAGLPVVEFRREQRTLEDAFVDLISRVTATPNGDAA
jgi:ABC-2 type transport system ATP-binding protein